MLNVMNGSTNGKEYELAEKEQTTNRAQGMQLDGPKIVSVLLNDICNLKCAHCYLENFESSDQLSKEEWDKVFDSLLGDLKPDAIPFAGKEVFAKKEDAYTMFDAINKRDELQKEVKRTDMGVITNGTLLDKFDYKEKIEQISLDWMDISVEGPREFNDEIRGKGTFSKLEKNLAWASEKFGNNLWITPTLCDANVKGMPYMIEDFNQKYGISNFSMGIYKSRVSAQNKFEASEKEVGKFIDDLSKTETNSPINVVISYATYYPHHKEYSEIFDMPESQGETVTKKDIDLGNNINVSIHRNNRKLGLWASTRITPNGYWVGAEDIMDHQNYNNNGVANLRDLNYDTRKAYETGLSSPKAKKFGFQPLNLPASK